MSEKKQKQLFNTLLLPTRGDFWPAIPTIVGNKHGDVIELKNGSEKALRVIVYDATEEWQAQQDAEREASEREQLATLKAKYEPQ